MENKDQDIPSFDLGISDQEGGGNMKDKGNAKLEKKVKQVKRKRKQASKPAEDLSDFRFRHHCKPNKIFLLAESLGKRTDDGLRRDIFETTGFGGILKLGSWSSGINSDFVNLVCNNFDAESMSIRLTGDLILPIHVEDVARVYGLPVTGYKVDVDDCSQKLIDTMREDFGLPERSNSTKVELDDIEIALSKQTDDILWCKLAIIFILGILLCPGSHADLSMKYLKIVQDLNNIRNYNWCQHVMDHIKIGMPVPGYKSPCADFHFMLINYLERTTKGCLLDTGDYIMPTCQGWNTTVVTKHLKDLGDFWGFDKLVPNGWTKSITRGDLNAIPSVAFDADLCPISEALGHYEYCKTQIKIMRTVHRTLERRLRSAGIPYSDECPSNINLGPEQDAEIGGQGESNEQKTDTRSQDQAEQHAPNTAQETSYQVSASTSMEAVIPESVHKEPTNPSMEDVIPEPVGDTVIVENAGSTHMMSMDIGPIPAPVLQEIVGDDIQNLDKILPTTSTTGGVAPTEEHGLRPSETNQLAIFVTPSTNKNYSPETFGKIIAESNEFIKEHIDQFFTPPKNNSPFGFVANLAKRFDEATTAEKTQTLNAIPESTKRCMASWIRSSGEIPTPISNYIEIPDDVEGETTTEELTPYQLYRLRKPSKFYRSPFDDHVHEASLSDDEKALLMYAWTPEKSPYDHLYEHKKHPIFTLTRREFCSLQENEMVNSYVIDVWANICNMEMAKPTMSRLILTCSPSFETLKKVRTHDIRTDQEASADFIARMNKLQWVKWWRDCKPTDLEMVLFPAWVDDHFVTYVLNLKERKMEFLNSYNNITRTNKNGTFSEYEQLGYRLMREVTAFLTRTYKVMKASLPYIWSEFVWEEPVMPQQPDACSCGIYTMKFVQEWEGHGTPMPSFANFSTKNEKAWVKATNDLRMEVCLGIMTHDSNKLLPQLLPGAREFHAMLKQRPKREPTRNKKMKKEK